MTLCSACKHKPPAEGYKLCQSCRNRIIKARNKPGCCTNCGRDNLERDKYKLCKTCRARAYARYDKQRNKGLCRSCGKKIRGREDVKRKCYCRECLQRFANNKQKKIQKELCSNCYVRKTTEGLKVCSECRKKHRESMAATTAAGLCRCRKPLDRKGIYCHQCLENKRIKKRGGVVRKRPAILDMPLLEPVEDPLLEELLNKEGARRKWIPTGSDVIGGLT